MPISRNQNALLHVAKAKLRLSDELYRLALVQVAGVTSSTELEREGFAAVMGLFEHLGFRPLDRRGAAYTERAGMARFAQSARISSIWAEYTRDRAGEEELNKWLLRCFRVSALRFLTAATAPKVITALKSMKTNAAWRQRRLAHRADR